MPASTASLDWSISLKNLMPLPAMSFFKRSMVSPIGKALFTAMTPSLPASAGDDTATAKKKLNKSSLAGGHGFVLLLADNASVHGQRDDALPREKRNCRLASISIPSRYGAFGRQHA